MKTETIEQVGGAANKVTLAGAGMTGWGWLASNEFLGLVGALVAVGGLVVTWYYKREANKRHADEHRLRMARLRRGMDSDTDLGELGAEE
ncbi:holin [Acidovorax radicis]|jgi:hypothetical protein|uniref:holin n=1 Tax=Acidovorax radicis TaxID=758826 RepID=UPI00023766CA|nr:holin [Acidovorax radicis]